MEPERARALLDAERARVQQLLADLDSAQTDDREAERETGDMADPAQPLAEQGVDSDNFHHRRALTAADSRCGRPSARSRRDPAPQAKPKRRCRHCDSGDSHELTAMSHGYFFS